MRKKKSPALHPGEALFEEFLKPLKISQNEPGRSLGVSARRINEIVHGMRSITANTTLRLARYFGNSPQFWLGLQMDYDLDIETDRLSSHIEKEVKKLSYAWLMGTPANSSNETILTLSFPRRRKSTFSAMDPSLRRSDIVCFYL